MNTKIVADIVHDVPLLEEAVVATVPEGLVVGAWRASGSVLDPEHAAAYCASFLRVARPIGKELGALREAPVIVLETPDYVCLSRPLDEELALFLVFSRALPLGLIRVCSEEVTTRLQRVIRCVEPDEAGSSPLLGPVHDASPH
jgi:predicted regulator of Ras-like GTPase activity (Roadblock/LC7/MglB family)